MQGRLLEALLQQVQRLSAAVAGQGGRRPAPSPPSPRALEAQATLEAVRAQAPSTRAASRMRKLCPVHTWFLFCIGCSLCLRGLAIAGTVTEKSPYFQHLPDCSKVSPSTYVWKKTASKGMVCPMVKDEEGFLSEWTAFYEMQGFDHVIFYDNNSTLPFTELAPWIASGFVEVRRNWWVNDSKLNAPKRKWKNKFDDMMRVKMLAEVDCKRTAVEMGYEIFVSLDMDEYVFPTRNDVTVMDELVWWFNTTTRGFVLLDKFQFPPTPHLLEPIQLLTIEAYQTRYPNANKMNYYTSVSNKVALRLQHAPEYSPETVQMMVHCCDFHGCGNSRFNSTCPKLLYSETGKITGKHRPWKQPPHIHHYARSLEKYVMKQKTWETASGHDSTGYTINNYFDRVSGFEFDDSAVKWGCQLRALLANRTGIKHYVRPGDSWYRNPEFGRTVEDAKKRSRFGHGYGIRLPTGEMNPYPPGLTYQGGHKTYVPPPSKSPTPPSSAQPTRGN